MSEPFRKLVEGFAAEPVIGPNQYQCSNCGGVFDKGWTDEEADKEHAANFPDASDEPVDTVCDDCYKLIMAWAKREGLVK